MDRVCPLLGLQGDGRTVVDGVDAGHRCHAEDQEPIPLDRAQQARICLTGAYDRCERYLARATRNGGLAPARSGIVEGLVSTRMILAPDPAWRGIAGRARGAPGGSLLAIGAAGLALGIGGVAVASGAIGEALEGMAAAASTAPSAAVVATPSPTATTTATPTLSPTPSATPLPSPTPTATPLPTEEPTVAPTAPPAPPAQETYVVQEGDTLAAIAERFGTTVSALQAANGIEDPNEIVIGQVLVIP